MIKIALLGCGRIGAMHAINIATHPRARLAAIYDINRSTAETVAALTGAPVMESAAAIFASLEVDAVLIATATDTHADLLEHAVAAGKPVLFEKPIDLSLARVNQCAAVIRGTPLPIQIGFVRRFDPGHKAVHDAVRTGDIGELHQVIVTSRDPGLAPEGYLKVSGGILRDMTIHDFDMARFILEKNRWMFSLPVASRVTCADGRSRRLRHGNSCDDHCIWQASHHYQLARSGVRIRPACGSLRQQGPCRFKNWRPHHMTLSGRGFTETAAPLLDFFIERYTEAFEAEITAFAQAVETGQPAVVGFEDGRLALVAS